MFQNTLSYPVPKILFIISYSSFCSMFQHKSKSKLLALAGLSSVHPHELEYSGMEGEKEN